MEKERKDIVSEGYQIGVEGRWKKRKRKGLPLYEVVLKLGGNVNLNFELNCR